MSQFGEEDLSIRGFETMNVTMDLQLPELPDNIKAAMVAKANHPRRYGLVAVMASQGHFYLLLLIKGRWTELLHRQLPQTEKIAWNDDGTKLVVGSGIHSHELTETTDGWKLR